MTLTTTATANKTLIALAVSAGLTLSASAQLAPSREAFPEMEAAMSWFGNSFDYPRTPPGPPE